MKRARTPAIPIPDTKLGDAFMAYAEPLLMAMAPDTAREFQDAMKLAAGLWNAVVYDTVRENSDQVCQIRQAMGEVPGATLVERMIERKRTLFGDDLRVVGGCEVTETSPGMVQIRVDAFAPKVTRKRLRA